MLQKCVDQDAVLIMSIWILQRATLEEIEVRLAEGNFDSMLEVC